MQENEQHTYEQIDQFLLGELKWEALKAFEERLLHDADFALQVNQQRILFEALTNKDVRRFRTKLETIQHNLDQVPKRKKGGSRLWWKFAAILIPLVGIVGWWWYQQNAELRNSERDFLETRVEEWNIYPNTLYPVWSQQGVERGINSNERAVDSLILEIRQAYKAGQNAAVLEILEQLPPAQTETDQYAFYLGLIQMRLGQSKKAISSFDRVKGGIYKQPAEWNSALLMVHIGQIEESIPLLKRLEREGYPDERAGQLLELLEKKGN